MDILSFQPSSPREPLKPPEPLSAPYRKGAGRDGGYYESYEIPGTSATHELRVEICSS